MATDSSQPFPLATFDEVYLAIQEQSGQTPELRTTGGVPFVAEAKLARDGRRFIALPHSNRIYESDWGRATNQMAGGGQRIRQYSVPLDSWVRDQRSSRE